VRKGRSGTLDTAKEEATPGVKVRCAVLKGQQRLPRHTMRTSGGGKRAEAGCEGGESKREVQ
jgi:hypothetical protein